jgi:hypothetical protein
MAFYNRMTECTQTTGRRAAALALEAGKQLQLGLTATTRRMQQARRLTGKIGTVGAELGKIMFEGSLAFAASNLSLSRDLLLATRKPVATILRSYQATLQETLQDFRRRTMHALHPSPAGKTMSAPRRRRPVRRNVKA